MWLCVGVIGTFWGLTSSCAKDDTALPVGDGSTFVDHTLSDTTTSCDQLMPRECREGVATAQCKSAQRAPRVFCSSGESGRCVWVSDGCPTGEYTHAIGENCGCSEATCPPTGVIASFYYNYGTSPWTDTSPAMAMSVSFDVDTNSEELNQAACQGPGAEDCVRPSICCSEITGIPGGEAVKLRTIKQLWDTLAIWIVVDGLHAGWHLLLEVDPGETSPVARVCRIPFTDSIHCGKAGVGRECFGHSPGCTWDLECHVPKWAHRERQFSLKRPLPWLVYGVKTGASRFARVLCIGHSCIHACRCSGAIPPTVRLSAEL